MSNDWPKVGFFAAGLAIGGVATATLVLGPYSPAARNRTLAKPAPSQATAVAFRGAECPMEPAAIISGDQDGRYRMPAELSGYATTEPNVFVAMGNEAAAAGRPHDAEIAYLMACRVADKFKGAGSVAAADARYELARYYTQLADAADKNAPNCGEILAACRGDVFGQPPALPGQLRRRSREVAPGCARAGGCPANADGAGGHPGCAVRPAPAVPPVAAAPQPGSQRAHARERDAPIRDRRCSAQPQARPAVDKSANGRRKGRWRQGRSARPACASARTTAERLICSDAGAGAPGP